MKLRDRRRRAAWSRQIRDWLAVRGITLVHPEGDTFEALCRPAHFGGDDPAVIRGEVGRVDGVRIIEDAEQVHLDVARHGFAISRGGKRIDPADVLLPSAERDRGLAGIPRVETQDATTRPRTPIRSVRRGSGAQALLALAALAIIGKP